MLQAIKIKLAKIKGELLNETLPKICYKSSILSSLYYVLFSSSFSRENQAVLAGKAKHIRETVKIKSNYFLLVRNTHRLEKGLLMRPRREVFATGFIKETVDSYIGIFEKQKEGNDLQSKWFTDVLSEFFKVCKSHPVIDAQRIRFLDFRTNKMPLSINASIPYCRDNSSFSKITYEDFYKLNKQRRSVRWFLEKPVARELIDKAILAAIQAPSACNRQPFEFRIIDDKTLLEKVVEIPMGTKGYSHSIQTFIVIVGNLDAYFDERDRHLIYIDASLANMSLMLAFETLGLSSCPINWPDIESREKMMAKFLNLKPYQRPVMCIGVGYPDPEGMVAYSEKRDLNKIRKFN
ncbi:nitroreductase family protein [Cyclobacterium marinum]|uniref:Nitroreductase n=1 Tax=Cyclobacterium marinum (strain ATCC 25205 / DSM 745 / LMG 13164 / NCIMB 1802) TaxID=880070 RepID=G0J663_CYCMS|nr:nitroreductase family protein [Cyclobacterium marinum]AEL26815.1 nitroreductase [Cyclobacterium marinum DSM 745]